MRTAYSMTTRRGEQDEDMRPGEGTRQEPTQETTNMESGGRATWNFEREPQGRQRDAGQIVQGDTGGRTDGRANGGRRVYRATGDRAVSHEEQIVDMPAFLNNSWTHQRHRFKGKLWK